MFVLEIREKGKKPDYLMNEFTALITIADNEKIKTRFENLILACCLGQKQRLPFIDHQIY